MRVGNADTSTLRYSKGFVIWRGSSLKSMDLQFHHSSHEDWVGQRHGRRRQHALDRRRRIQNRWKLGRLARRLHHDLRDRGTGRWHHHAHHDPRRRGWRNDDRIHDAKPTGRNDGRYHDAFCRTFHGRSSGGHVGCPGCVRGRCGRHKQRRRRFL